MDYSYLFKAIGIVFREAFEAVLIYGIMTSFVRKLPGERTRELNAVRWGLILGIIASLVLAGLLVGASSMISDEFFSHLQLVVLFAGSLFMLYMVFWMSKHVMSHKKELETGLANALENKGLWTFIGVIFVAVFREGVELVVYLYSLSLESPGASGASMIVISMAAGLGLAFVVYAGILAGARWLSFRRVFLVTGAWLLISASSLLATAIDQLYSLGYLPNWAAPVFAVELNGESIMDRWAMFFESIVGFRFQPSPLHLVTFLAFWLLVIFKDPLRLRKIQVTKVRTT